MKSVVFAICGLVAVAVLAITVWDVDDPQPGESAETKTADIPSTPSEEPPTHPKAKGSETAEAESAEPDEGETKMNEKAVLAGGCFWGMQELIRNLPGVIDTRVGYTGGDVPNATYPNHGTHAEAIEIIFDPNETSYRRMLEFFFQIHDPTTLNRQGNDIGTSYRSAIFYTSDEQKLIAEDTIKDVDASGLWPGKVVTEVAAASDFWEAEPEHQDYLQRLPNGYTCHFIRPGWVLPKRSESSAE